MTELSFLLDLLLNEKLTKPVKEKITARIKEIESNPAPAATSPASHRGIPTPGRVINGAVQSPSTAAALARQQAEEQGIAPETGGQLIASPAAAAAIASRQQAINEAINSTHNGKTPPGRTSPRKF